MRGRDRVTEIWTLGKVRAMISAVNCVRLMIHRPVPLKQIIHYMLIKKINLGAPGWLSGLSLCLRLRSWSQGPGMEPHMGSLLRMEPASPSLSAYL